MNFFYFIGKRKGEPYAYLDYFYLYKYINYANALWVAIPIFILYTRRRLQHIDKASQLSLLAIYVYLNV